MSRGNLELYLSSCCVSYFKCAKQKLMLLLFSFGCGMSSLANPLFAETSTGSDSQRIWEVERRWRRASERGACVRERFVRGVLASKG